MPSASAPMPAPSSSGARRVGQAAPLAAARRGRSRAPATIARPTGTLMRKSARQPSVSTSTPPSAGPGGRGEGARGAPRADRRGAALGRRVGEDDRQRGGDHRRGGRALQAARDEQHAERRRERRSQRHHREAAGAAEQQRPPPDDVGDAAGRGEQRRERDGVDRDDPRRAADASRRRSRCARRRPRGSRRWCRAARGRPRPRR